MKKYYNYNVKKSVSIQNLVTIEYINLSSNFYYPEETHQFYEFIYVENGNIVCKTENQEINLIQGNFYMIKERQTHSYVVPSDKTATVFIVCFKCKTELLNILADKISLNRECKSIVNKIFVQSKNAFRFPFNKKIIPLDEAPFGAQQLVENYIEELLLILIKDALSEKKDIKLVQSNLELENNLVQDIIELLKENLYTNVSLTEISRNLYYSKTFLNTIFKKNTRTTIMHYYTQLKIKKAKTLIENNLSITEISYKLNFESPNYFSKVFKKHTDLSPTQYKELLRK